MQVFAMRVPRFDPVAEPFVAFGIGQGYDALIQRSEPGDVIVLVGNATGPTLDEDRGRLLGIAEFVSMPVDVSCVFGIGSICITEPIDGSKNDRPKVLPILRAWKFQPKLKLIDTLK
jgi:hypothetical protein